MKYLTVQFNFYVNLARYFSNCKSLFVLKYFTGKPIRILPKVIFHTNRNPSFCENMDLKSVIKTIEGALPPELAEIWDKTGLLVKPDCNMQVSSIFFTIDLTEKVLDEAIDFKTNMIIAYHPPIFSPMSKLVSDNWKDRIVMKCVKHSIAVYSPHTICDIVKNGVNDWLIKCFDVCDIKAIQPKKDFSDMKSIFEFTLPVKVDWKNLVDSIVGFEVLSVNRYDDLVHISLSTNFPESHAIKILTSHAEVQFVSHKSSTRNDFSKGVGRVAKLKIPMKLNDCITSVKNFLNLKNVRFALAANHNLDTAIEKIAVCAGSGASVLKDVDADLYLTGEMSHHEILHATHQNVSIILVEHSNSERGYLKNLIHLLQPQLRNIKLNLSAVDKDPISII